MNLFDQYRNDFGIFRSNPNIAYFDYATTTFVPDQVLERYSRYNREIGVSLSRGNTLLHKKAQNAYDEAVNNLINFFTNKSDYRLIFGKNTTELINLISCSIEEYIKPLDFIVVGPYEHHSNYLPWKRLAEKTGALFVEMPITLDGEIDYDYLNKIAPSIKLLSVSEVSNTNGYKIDINKILNNISSNAFVMVDAAQSVAHGPIDVNDKISCIFLSSHKMYGPKNISGVLVKNKFLELLKPVFLGGGMVETVGLTETWMTGENKFLAGTIDASLIVQWSAACDYLKNIGFSEISRKERYIYEKIKNKLKNMNGVTVIEQGGHAATSLISFVHEKIHAHDIQEYFSQNNIFVRSGNLCSQNSLLRYGFNAITRISFGIGITDKCLNKMLNALDCLDKKVNDFTHSINKKVIIPDEVLSKDGIACGDAVDLIGEVNDGIIEFNISVNGCSQAKCAAKKLNDKYNNHDINYVLKDCEIYYNSLASSLQKQSKEFHIDEFALRSECILSVIRVFLEFAKKLSKIKIEICEIDETSKTLACDACVSISRINWGNHKVKKVKPFRRSESKLCAERQSEWQRCGKLCLSQKEISLLKNLCCSMTDDDFDYLWSNKLDQIIFDHLKNYNMPITDVRWKKTVFANHRKNVIRHEAEYIQNFIKSNNIVASYVKGAMNQDLYTDKYDRVFMDYDILAGSANDAFDIAHFLLNRGFHILFDVFSLKEIQIGNRTEITGHFHMKKFIDYRYQLIIDVSFPAYPLGRIGLFYPKFEKGILSQEEQFIITLCHLFKHEVVFMKDINDLYMMIKKVDLNYQILNKLIEQYELKFFFSVAVLFIFDNYDISENIKLKIKNIIDINEYIDIVNNFNLWPFNSETVYKDKEMDYKKRLLMSVDKKRIYLFPLIMFDTPYRISKTSIKRLVENSFAFSSLCEGIYELRIKKLRFLLTSMGLFIDNSSDIQNSGRKNVRDYATQILNICEIKDFLGIPYLTNDWYY